MDMDIEADSQADLATFFNHHHDKIVCTANTRGEPNVAIIGTMRMVNDHVIQFEITEDSSTTLENLSENRAMVVLNYEAADRARNYQGARLYARAQRIVTAGVEFQEVYDRIALRLGAEKAAALKATVICQIEKVRPIIDLGQSWYVPPFAKA